MSRIIFLDTETTGLDPKAGHRIIELAMIEMIDDKLTGDRRHWYFNPEREIEASAVSVHGITNAQLVNEPLFASALPEITAFVHRSILVSHNAIGFDVPFLNREIELTQGEFAPIESYCDGIIDTLVEARKLLPGKRHSLSALCKHFGIPFNESTLHSAVVDTELLAQIYKCLRQNQGSLDLTPYTSALSVSTASPSVIPATVVREATQEELNAHHQYLARMAKETGITPMWPVEPE